MPVTQAGLEGIVAAESDICFIDGDEGLLSYQGFNIHTLAEHATFEEVIYLLWHGKLAETVRTRRAEERSRAVPAHPQGSYRVPRQSAQSSAHGCAAHRRFHAGAVRSQSARQFYRSKRRKSRASDGADRDRRYHL